MDARVDDIGSGRSQPRADAVEQSLPVGREDADAGGAAVGIILDYDVRLGPSSSIEGGSLTAQVGFVALK